MNIQVQFYGQLRDLAKTSHLTIEISSGATAAELLENIYQTRPALRAQDNNILVGAGVDFVKRNYVLSEGEEVAVMPPVQGG